VKEGEDCVSFSAGMLMFTDWVNFPSTGAWKPQAVVKRINKAVASRMEAEWNFRIGSNIVHFPFLNIWREYHSLDNLYTEAYCRRSQEISPPQRGSLLILWECFKYCEFLNLKGILNKWITSGVGTTGKSV
jgi:hypothetical protein